MGRNAWGSRQALESSVTFNCAVLGGGQKEGALGGVGVEYKVKDTVRMPVEVGSTGRIV